MSLAKPTLPNDWAVAEAKLAGDWPGYEALKNFQPSYPEDTP